MDEHARDAREQAVQPARLVAGAEVLHRVHRDALGVLEERLVPDPPEPDDLDLVLALQVLGEVEHRPRGAALAPAADGQDGHPRRVAVVLRARLRAHVTDQQTADQARDCARRGRGQGPLAGALSPRRGLLEFACLLHCGHWRARRLGNLTLMANRKAHAASRSVPTSAPAGRPSGRAAAARPSGRRTSPCAARCCARRRSSGIRPAACW